MGACLVGEQQKEQLWSWALPSILFLHLHSDTTRAWDWRGEVPCRVTRKRKGALAYHRHGAAAKKTLTPCLYFPIINILRQVKREIQDETSISVEEQHQESPFINQQEETFLLYWHDKAGFVMWDIKHQLGYLHEEPMLTYSRHEERGHRRGSHWGRGASRGGISLPMQEKSGDMGDRFRSFSIHLPVHWEREIFQNVKE